MVSFTFVGGERTLKPEKILYVQTDGQMIYSYQEEVQSFNIFINCDGENKTYTIKGIDENGQEIEEVLDPYNIDPEMMDFPEFSALCMYIRLAERCLLQYAWMIMTSLTT